MRVVFCGTGWLPMVDAIRARLPAGTSIRLRDPHAPLVDELRDANVILPSNCVIDAAAIDAPRDLRLIQQPAAGIDIVDLDAARARGVPVCNAPGANADAVAEMALLLMLSLARRVKPAAAAFARADLGVPLGVELRGKTLGIVGLGRSGAALARIAEAVGMRVRSVRSTSTDAERAHLLATADIVSLHLPLTDATRGSIDPAAMKPGAFLVNCARGAIVDRAALEAALASGHLGGVGLDTYWEEPWDPDDPLYARDDVVTLPHTAGSTVETFSRIAGIVADNIARVVAGTEPRFRVI